MSKKKTVFKSSIAHHGSYIWETKEILKEYSKLRSHDEVREKVIDENILNKSSERYRKSIFEEIKRRYIPDEEEFEETPLIKVINSTLSDLKKDWILYYEFSRDDLLYELITCLIYKKYSKGATYVEKEEILDYLIELEDEHPEIQEWSEKTALRVAQHFLASLKNFGILEGSKRKKFKYISPPKEAIVYALYSMIESGVDRTEKIINHDDWKLFMLKKDNLRERLSNISSEYIRYEKRGSVEKIEPKYDSIGEVVDVF